MSQELDTQDTLVRCALPVPLRDYLDYRVPAGMARPEIGSRVLAPVGKRRLVGIVCSHPADSEVSADKIRAIESVLDSEKLIDLQLQALLAWTSAYYQHPPGETFPLALSPRERRGEPPAATGLAGFQLNVRGQGLAPQALARAPKQRAMINALQSGAKSREALLTEGFNAGTIRALLARDLIERVTLQDDQPWLCREPLVANGEQAAAIAAVNQSHGTFHCHLLEGVTGSGKTEVYLQAIAATLATQHQVLVLVPEIGLTPQLLERFHARFDAPVVTLHSLLGDTERDRSWQAAREGSAAIILGTRSAVFAPLARLGLIIVDEEHDVSLSQQDGLRYSARDVAVKRAQLCQCPVVLGSATPSLESMANAESGRYQWHRLTQRAAGALPPSKNLIDIRGLALTAGLSPELEAAVDGTLGRGEQVLLFLNRRGYAPTLLCQDCGWVAECPQCDARQTLHKQPPRLQCHHCANTQPLPRHCPGCRSTRLLSSGLGTEQTEQVLRHRYADVPIHRVDSDTMTGRHAMAMLSREVTQGEACVLLGTQMLTKGHHFPGVTCVGILDADTLLFSPDFRGEERLAQLLTQVGGRAGRAMRPGTVHIQTRHPEHPILATVMNDTWSGISQRLLEQRRRQGLPPRGSLAAVRCDSPKAQEGYTFLETLLLSLAKHPDCRETRVIGPLQAPLARRAGLHRWHLMVIGPSRARVHARVKQLVAAALATRPPAKLRWFVDIDPTEPL